MAKYKSLEDYLKNNSNVKKMVGNGSTGSQAEALQKAHKWIAIIEDALSKEMARVPKPASGYTTSYTHSSPSVNGTSVTASVSYTPLPKSSMFPRSYPGGLHDFTQLIETGFEVTSPTAPAWMWSKPYTASREPISVLQNVVNSLAGRAAADGVKLSIE